MTKDVYGVAPIKTKIRSGDYDIEKMVDTDDQWCPNYPNDEVKVSMFIDDFFDNEIIVKVAAWGVDDIGVELEYTTSKDDYGYYMAERVWNLWKEHIYDKTPKVVDIEWFLDRGFLWGMIK